MAATNPNLLRYDGRMGVDLNGRSVPFATDGSWHAEEADRMTRQQQSMAGHNRLVRIGQLASIAPFAVAGGAAMAGGGAAGGIGGLPAGMAPGGAMIQGAPSAAAGGGMPWLRLGELGAGLFSNLMGNRSQNRANDREFAYRTSADQRAYEMAQAQEAQRQKEWAAQQAMSEKAFAAQQEQLRLDREEEARQNKIAEAYAAANEGRNVARENQRVPYRQAGQIALRDLVSGLR